MNGEEERAGASSYSLGFEPRRHCLLTAGMVVNGVQRQPEDFAQGSQIAINATLHANHNGVSYSCQHCTWPTASAGNGAL